tara:strand:- start:306 stop:635 length:330 start_codon:yes stop_codon:yes gene_type:complete
MKKFSNPFMAKSPLKHQGAAQEIKDVSELPGYQPIIGSSVNIPGRKTAAAKAAAIATGFYTLGTFAYNSIKNKLNQKPKGQRRGDLGYQRVLDKEKFDEVADVAKKIRK